MEKALGRMVNFINSLSLIPTILGLFVSLLKTKKYKL